MLNYDEKSNYQECWQWFTELCKNPEETQQEVLNEILKNADKSLIAQKYNFNSVKSIKDFQKNIPVTYWNDYESYALKIQDGEKDILFNGFPEAFIMTCGTSGKPKLIPETKNGFFAKSITDKLRQYFSLYPFKEIQKGKILPLVNSITLGETKSGIPFGMASGLTLSKVPEQIKNIFAYPIDILNMKDSEALDYLLMRFALNEDVRFIVGNNMAKMEKLVQLAQIYSEIICDDIEKGTISEIFTIEPQIKNKLLEKLTPDPERANELRKILKSGEFIPKTYWKNLVAVCCWLSGSIGAYLQNAKYLFPKNTIYLDYGYGATEGKFNIPRIQEKSYGVLTIHSAFYEFTDINEPENFLCAHNLKAGEYYNIYVTNFSGLYRYDIKDIVKVESFYHNTPEIIFVSKTGDVGNLSGEKLAGSAISFAAQKIIEEMGLKLKHIAAFPSQNPPHYIFYIEIEDSNNNIDLEYFTKEIDLKLQQDIGYKIIRQEGFILYPETKLMPLGWMESLYKEKESEGISRVQLKLPIILSEPPI